MKNAVIVYLNFPLYYELWKNQVEEHGVDILKKSTYFTEKAFQKYYKYYNECQEFFENDEYGEGIKHIDNYNDFFGSKNILENLLDDTADLEEIIPYFIPVKYNFIENLEIDQPYKNQNLNFEFEDYFYIDFNSWKLKKSRHWFINQDDIERRGFIRICLFKQGPLDLFQPMIEKEKLFEQIYNRFPALKNADELELEIIKQSIVLFI